MYTLRWGIQSTPLQPQEITDDHYFILPPTQRLNYKKKDEYQPEQSFSAYPHAPNPDGGSWPDYSPPSYDYGSGSDSSIYDSGSSDTGSSFDFGGGDGGGGGTSGDY